MSYPKWLYHPTKAALIVPDEAAHKALGDEWKESPADCKPAGDFPGLGGYLKGIAEATSEPSPEAKPKPKKAK